MKSSAQHYNVDVDDDDDEETGGRVEFVQNYKTNKREMYSAKTFAFPFSFTSRSSFRVPLTVPHKRYRMKVRERFSQIKNSTKLLSHRYGNSLNEAHRNERVRPRSGSRHRELSK